MTPEQQRQHVIDRLASRVHVTPDRPKYQLPEDVMVPDAFRAEFNAWARDFFGCTNVIDDNTIISIPGIGDSHMYVNPRTHEAIIQTLMRSKP